MAEVLGDNERRDLYRKMLNDAVTSESTRKYSFKDFEKKLLGDPELIRKISGLSLKRGWALDENDFTERFVPELKAPPVEEQRYTPPPQPVVGSPEYDKQLQNQYEGMSPTLGATFEGAPASFETKEQKKQEQISPVFKAQQLAFEDVPIAEEQRRAQRQFAKADKQQLQAALIGSTGAGLKKSRQAESEGTMDRVLANTEAFWEGAKNAGINIFYGLKTVMNVVELNEIPMDEDDRQYYQQQEFGKMYKASKEAGEDYQNELYRLNVSTDVLDAIDKGDYGKIPEATLQTIGNVGISAISSYFTLGGSMYFQTLPDSYREGVEAIAKQKGITPEEVIRSGEDAKMTALTVAGISSALEIAGAGYLSKSIANKGGYKAVRDYLIRNGFGKNVGSATGLGYAGIGEGSTEYAQQATQQLGGIAAASKDASQFFKKLPKEFFNEQAAKERLSAGVSGFVGGAGVVGMGRGLKRSFGPGVSLNKFSDNVVNNEIIQEAARGYGDNITKAEKQGKKPDSFNQKQLKKISENPEAWVRDEIKYIQQTIESNKTLGLDSKVEENSLAKATSLLNQIKAEKKGMEEADIAPAQEAAPVAPKAEVVSPEPIAPEVTTEEDLAEDIPFEEVPAETEDELAFLDEMRLTPEEEAALLAQERIIPAAPVAPAEEVTLEVVPAEPVTETPKAEQVDAPLVSKNDGGNSVGGEKKQQELDAQKINKEAGVDIYVARQGVDANGSKYTLSQIKENGNTNTFLIEDANGNEIGKAQLSAGGNYLENIRIDEKHRRKGLASKVYDFIELRKGIELEPSPNKQSKEAKALWDNRNLKKSVSNKANGGVLAKSLGEAMSKTFADFKNKQQVLLELENKYFEQKGLSKEDFNKLSETEKAEIIKDAIKWKNNNPELVKAVEQSLKEQPKAVVAAAPAPKVEPAKTNEEQIAILRAEEQAELDSRIKGADKYRGPDGKVDRTKLTNKADIKAFNKVYAKYDKLISPLMETKPAAPKKEEAPKPEPTAKKIDKKSVQASLDKAKEEYEKAKGAFDKKRSELDKTTREDIKDLFGERKVEMKGQGLFKMPRISPEQRERAIQPFRDKVNKAKEEVNRLTKMLEEGKDATKELTFEKQKEYEQVQGVSKETRKGKSEPKTERVVRPKAKPIRNAGKTPDAITARNIAFYGDPAATTLQYLMDATYHPDLLERIFGGPSKTTKSGRKDISGERKSRIQFLDNNSNVKTADKLAEVLAERYAEENNIDVKDAEQQYNFASIAIDIVSSYSSRSQMVRELLRLNDQQSEAFDFMYNPEEIYGEGYNEDIAKDIDGVLDELPDSYWEGKEISDASQEFDGMKKPSKIKTKSFDGKHGKGAFERMKNITDNFEDIMDGMSGKIKQDCL